jgi:alkanesulfonate monooxygenase SsuD/methylene tetrahydromethanopterin reductase-like flavin-dependent oxidoreductase (luciferase family)
MRFSIWPSLAQPWSDVVQTVRHAEATGWDGVYVADHFMGNSADPAEASVPMLEATAAIAALATVTHRVRLGPLVLGMTYRHPAVVANWAASVDRISDGRLVLGLGAGWQVNEHEQYGIELPPPGPLVSRFHEGVRVIEGMLRDERTTVAGDYYQVTDALCEPKPVQARVPLLVGGKGDRMLGLVARHADEWNMWGLPEAIAERSAVLDRQCEKADRDPGTVARSCQAVWFLDEDGDAARARAERSPARAALGGTPRDLAGMVRRWAEVGISEVIVPDFSLGTGSQKQDTMDAIIEVVAPLARS